MAHMTSRVYNTTDGPLLIDAEGHVLAGRESTKVPNIDDEPIHSHLDAGRLIDLTDAKEEGAEADEALAEAARQAEEDAKASAPKPTPPAKRS